MALFAACFFMLWGCETEKKKHKKVMPVTPSETKPEKPVQVPDFNPDSAYHFIKQQVEFGPRVPNTEAHAQCAQYLEKKLNTYGFETLVQEGKVAAYNGKMLDIKNIIGRYAPENKNRVLLFAHWDTRPYADRDTKNRAKPILGANDGASGVGVLLEIARQIYQSDEKPAIGIDIIFFDAEDYGQPRETMIGQKSDTWCLGSQYWAKNPPIKNYSARYGILLDMVGAADAKFPKEGNSMKYAPGVVEKVWDTAYQLGYENYFSPVKTMGGLTDDHLYVNVMAGIPSIDIIHYIPYKNDFGDFHHTHKDNMDIIAKPPLKAVGQTVLTVIYNEN